MSSAPELSLEGLTLPIAAVELTLAAGGGPVLTLQVPSGHGIVEAERLGLLGKKVRGGLTWGESKVSFRLLRTEWLANGCLQVSGLTLTEDLLGWFETCCRTEDGRPMLVYQRQEVDSDGWAFVRRVLGDKFEEPVYSGDFEPWFPVGTCVLRPSGWDNLAHIERVVSLLGALPGGTCGWCAVGAEDGDQPLRLVATEAELIQLDEAWRLASSGGGRRRGQAQHYEIHRRLGPLSGADAAKILFELACSGRRSNVDGAASATITSQLPHMAMPVQLGETVLLCSKAVYRWASPYTLMNEPFPMLDVELFLTPLPSKSWAPALTWSGGGLFGKWDDPSEKKRIRIKSTDQTWALMGDGGADDDGADTAREASASGKALLCDSLTPYAARGDFSGFYVKHQKDDQLVVQITEFAVPRSPGALHLYAEKFEGPELTLNSRTIALTGIANTGELDVTGTLLDGDSGTYKIFAEKEVRIKEKISVVDEKTKFDQNVEVTGTAKVTKDATLEAKLEVGADAKVKGKLDVGS